MDSAWAEGGVEALKVLVSGTAGAALIAWLNRRKVASEAHKIDYEAKKIDRESRVDEYTKISHLFDRHLAAQEKELVELRSRTDNQRADIVQLQKDALESQAHARELARTIETLTHQISLKDQLIERYRGDIDRYKREITQYRVDLERQWERQRTDDLMRRVSLPTEDMPRQSRGQDEHEEADHGAAGHDVRRTPR